MSVAIIVHGGAGAWKLRGGNLPEAEAACAEAAGEGQKLLLAGRPALEAVEAAVRILEDCPILDAGRGSYLTTGGTVEMDAFIMDGRTLNVGAVGAVQLIKNPITLARLVLEYPEHNFLVGPGAEAFAERVGCPRCKLEDLVTPAEWERFQELQRQAGYNTQEIFVKPESMGTVGAVALDSAGNLAAATSTGGTRHKLPGRIGDTPLPGSGGYADNWTAAASATGHGESLMKVLICKQVCDFVGLGLPAQAATESAIRMLQERVSGRGGVIAIDARGNVGFAYNTDAMPHAFAVGGGPVQVAH